MEIPNKRLAFTIVYVQNYMKTLLKQAAGIATMKVD